MDKISYGPVLDNLKKDFSMIIYAYSLAIDNYITYISEWTSADIITCENNIFHFLTTNIDLGLELWEHLIRTMDNIIESYEKDFESYKICNKIFSNLKKNLLNKLIELKNRTNWTIEVSQGSVKAKVSWTLSSL